MTRTTGSAVKMVGASLAKDGELKMGLQGDLCLAGGFLKRSTNTASERWMGCTRPG